MVFFVLSREGLESCLSIGANISASLWIPAGILSQSELDELRSSELSITNFNYEIGLDASEVIDAAVQTIKEHHPNEVIWVQH
ncbi:MAG: hypothetical protein ACXWGW_16370 [Methylobacter sp.]